MAGHQMAHRLVQQVIRLFFGVPPTHATHLPTWRPSIKAQLEQRVCFRASFLAGSLPRALKTIPKVALLSNDPVYQTGRSCRSHQR